jgi:phage-related protein
MQAFRDAAAQFSAETVEQARQFAEQFGPIQEVAQRTVEILSGVADIPDRAPELVGALVQAVGTVIREVTTFVSSEALPEAWATVRKTLDEIIAELIDVMHQAGVDAIEGLMRGLKERLPALLALARQIANQVAKTIQSALAIHSPSRVMYRLGQAVSEGFALGIADSVRIVEGAVSQLAGVGGFGAGLSAPMRGYLAMSRSGAMRAVSGVPAGGETRLDVTLQLDSDIVARSVVRSISSRLRLYGQLG